MTLYNNYLLRVSLNVLTKFIFIYEYNWEYAKLKISSRLLWR